MRMLLRLCSVRWGSAADGIPGTQDEESRLGDFFYSKVTLRARVV